MAMLQRQTGTLITRQQHRGPMFDRLAQGIYSLSARDRLWAVICLLTDGLSHYLRHRPWDALNRIRA